MEIVLVNPEIPQNTGSIARTCAATKTPLHLIRPMKFEIDEKRVRRAGLDYWPYVNLTIHDSWEAYIMFKRKSASQEAGHVASCNHPSSEHPAAILQFAPTNTTWSNTIWCLEEFGDAPYDEVKFAVGDSLVFGPETSGLTPDFLTAISCMDYGPRYHHAKNQGDSAVRTIAIPMAEPGVRSLNLSNAVAIVLYEARRQLRLDRPFKKRPPKASHPCPSYA